MPVTRWSMRHNAKVLLKWYFQHKHKNWKITLNAVPALVVIVFGVPIAEKIKFARSIIKFHVNIKYSVADFKVASIEKAE